jgi:hypothetical protein
LAVVVVVYRSLVGLSVDVVFGCRSVVAFLCLSGLALVSLSVSGVEEEDEERRGER